MLKNYVALVVLVLSISILFATRREPFVSEYKIASNNTKLESDAAFNMMMDVVMHQRCINCHPNDNVPKQGYDSHPHYFGISRGPENSGFQATACTTCHQSENNEYSGVPGAPHWSLAPSSMGWQGLGRKAVAERMLNEKLNGGKNHEELIRHMTEDELVLWAWEPGVGVNGVPRELPPVSEEDFKNAVKEWFKNGAIIPSK